MLILYLLAGLFVLAGAGLAYWAIRPASTPPFLDGDGRPLPNSIAALEKVEVGGVDQWLIIRGRDVSNPVLLYLHGGPGTPATPFLHHFNANLEEHFVVVAWEQRGAGKSYTPGIPPESLTVEQFVRDTHQVTHILKERFAADNLYLVGHSWGAHLGLLVAQRYPQDYYAYVGVSQPVCLAQNEALTYRWTLDTAQARGNRRAIRELEAIGPPSPDGSYQAGFESLLVKARWVRAFGGALHGRAALPVLARILLLSPVYTLREKVNYLRGEAFTMRHMWHLIPGTDLARQVPALTIPAYFCHGEHDYQAVCSLAREYCRQLQAPRKRFVSWPDAAHGAMMEEPEAFLALMLDVVAETYPHATSTPPPLLREGP